MKSPEDLQSAFVLHTRPYRETSLLVDLYTKHNGIIPAIARGVRGQKSNVKRALLQPFQPVLCRWRGRGELVTLTDIDSGGRAVNLTKEALFSGLYINELLLRLLHRYDPHEALFHIYQSALQNMSNTDNLESELRTFEIHLLNEIGYGLSLEYDIEGEDIVADKQYWLTTQGMLQTVTDDMVTTTEHKIYEGRIIQGIASQNWASAEVLKNAKQLMRAALHPLLGNKPIQSRKLFRSKKQ